MQSQYINAVLDAPLLLKFQLKGLAEDLDWINSFGIKKKGRKEVQDFLDWCFSLPNSKERKDIETIASIRFIKPDVALVYGDFHVENQKYLNDEIMETRNGLSIRVMIKENDKWQITSMLFMDEKPRSPKKSDK